MGFRMDRVVGLGSWPVFLAGVIAVGCAAQAQTPDGSWAQRAPMPAVRGEVAAAEVGGKLYAVGGNLECKALPRNEEYDPATNRWRARTLLPEPRDHLGHTFPENESYDAKADRWVTRRRNNGIN